MTPRIQLPVWRVTGRSVRGAAHRRRNQINQDAMLWDASEHGVAAAIADGHGSSACFRSDVGARLAVEACIRSLMEAAPGGEDALLRVPQALVTRWRDAVSAHLAAEPLTAAELTSLNGRSSDPPWTIYGTTLVAVLAAATHVAYLQLGDGDILIVDRDRNVTRPWPRDPRFLGVETSSLSGPNPLDDLRLRIEQASDASPALLLLATDGYANSFREDSGFLRTGPDVLEMIQREGIGPIDHNLESWLTEATECGSGDDTTVVVLTREKGASENGG